MTGPQTRRRGLAWPLLVVSAALVALAATLVIGWLNRYQPEYETPGPVSSTYEAPPPDAEVDSPFDDQ